MKAAPDSWWQGVWLRACRWCCGHLSARQQGRLFEQLQIAAAGQDPRIGQYALEYNNPQALRFLIDAYPTLERLFATFGRMDTIELLDLGAAFGGGAGLLSQMHRSHFLGPRLAVTALDIVDSRRAFIEVSYPQVDFRHADITALPAHAQWDVIYCSNAIEHMDDPRAFIRQVLRHTRRFAVFLAPYREAPPLSLDHRLQIDENTFDGFTVESLQVIRTAAWPTTADGIERQQMLVVLTAP